MKVSVIIPCYNDGQYLTDAVNSVLAYPGNDVELIIVNDGSTDPFTINVLNNYAEKGFKILSHQQVGLAYSRNIGIREAAGEYILPLDADNKIMSEYITKAIHLLNSPKIDIVYGKPLFIGEDIPERKFQTKKFDGCNLLFGNYIDACAVFRKSVWEKVGGFDENMPVKGSEDWEFWLSSYLLGFKFTFIDEELYEYRIRNDSMIAEVFADKMNLNHNYIIVKHKNLILNEVKKDHLHGLFYEKDQENYFRTALKYCVKGFKKILSNQRWT